MIPYYPGCFYSAGESAVGQRGGINVAAARRGAGWRGPLREREGGEWGCIANDGRCTGSARRGQGVSTLQALPGAPSRLQVARKIRRVFVQS